MGDPVKIAAGTIVLGELPEPMRDGNREVALCWEAKLLPARVCEGGGWYSAHPTEQRWEVRSWMRHKGAPGGDWPSVAGAGASGDLEAELARIEASARKRYGFAVRRELEREQFK